VLAILSDKVVGRDEFARQSTDGIHALLVPQERIVGKSLE
jgi:hypothetical protein